MSAGSVPTSEQMNFPRALAPIGAFFVVVPAAVILTGLVVLLTWRLTWSLMLLMVLVIGCCGLLIRDALTDMSEVTVEWTGLGVTINSLLGSRNFAWTEVEKVEMLDPGPTFGDFGRHEDRRAAVGLFIRDPKIKERPIDAKPEVIVVCRSGDAVTNLPKLAERLATAKRNGGGPGGTKEIRKIGQPVAQPKAPATKPGKGFRRKAG